MWTDQSSDIELRQIEKVEQKKPSDNLTLAFDRMNSAGLYVNFIEVLD